MRFTIALVASKLYLQILKILKKEKDDRPGALALKICPLFLEKINKPKVLIGITGTNGKTTTTNLLSELLIKSGQKVIYNDWGANTKRGMARCLIEGVNILNHSKKVYGILEIDEVTCDETLPKLQLDYLLVTNLFRDSMFRNPNPYYVYDKIEKGLTKKTTLFLNSDDAFSSRLGKKTNKCIYYGIDKLKSDTNIAKNIVNDMQVCPICLEKLNYEYIRFNHIGKVKCKNCGFQNPEPNYLAKINFSKKEISINNQIYPLIHDSIFNAYNEVLVISFLLELNIKSTKIKEYLEHQNLTKRRLDIVKNHDLEVITMACKGFNPVALSTVFDYLKNEKCDIEVILVLDDLSDRVNSSEAINYLYDADFEFLNEPHIKKIIIGGHRCYDYLYRLLLADIDPKKIETCENEFDTSSKVDKKNIKKIYILHDIYFVSGAKKIRDDIISEVEHEN